MRTKEIIKKEIADAMSLGEPFFKIEYLLDELAEISKKEVLDKVESKIKSEYNKKDVGFEYWFSGNFDDTFEMGLKTGIRDTLYSIGTKLGIELEEPEELESEPM